MTQAEYDFLTRAPRLLKDIAEQLEKINENLEKLANKE